MSDLITRQDFDKCLEDAEKEAVKNRKYVFASALNTIRGNLRNFPSAQPEIIACGDCEHWICHERRCGYWNHGVKPLDWCCHAERRADDR